MSNKEKALILATKHHAEYIKMALAISGNNMDVRNYAEDYVQEVYLRLFRYDDLYDKIIKPNGKVSKGYIFFVLRSIIINAIKKKGNLKYNHLGDQYDFEEKFMHVDTPRDEQTQAMDDLEELMLKRLKENAPWFDFNLFKTYIKSGKSFKSIAEESGIGVRTIYLSIKKSKLIIAKQMHEDYMDYVNGEYDLI